MTVVTCILVMLVVEQPMVKLLLLVTVNMGTPTEAVTCTDLVDLQPVRLLMDSNQYTPGWPG